MYKKSKIPEESKIESIFSIHGLTRRFTVEKLEANVASKRNQHSAAAACSSVARFAFERNAATVANCPEESFTPSGPVCIRS